MTHFDKTKLLQICGVGALALVLGISALSVSGRDSDHFDQAEELSLSAEPEELAEESAEEAPLETGWTTADDGMEIYIQEDGTMATGWTELDDGTYYFTGIGHPVKNRFMVKGETYLFSDHGRLMDKEALQDSLDTIKSTETISGFGGFSLTPDMRKTLNAALDKVKDPNGRNYNVGFIMVDLNSGTGVSYNVDNKVYAASSIKGLYLPSVVSYKEDVLKTYESSFKGILMYSDNDLYRSARQRWGIEPFRIWCEDAGINDPEIYSYYYPQYTPRIMAKLWLQNYFFFQLDENGRTMSEWYQCPNQSAIYATLGNADTNKNAVVTQSKAGWIAGSQYRYVATNDGGIIYDEHPYIICITSNLPSAMDKLNPLVEAIDEVHHDMYLTK